MTNDTLARLVRYAGPGQWVMWECECGDGGCAELVTLSLREFDELRARGAATSSLRSTRAGAPRRRRPSASSVGATSIAITSNQT